MKTLLEFMMDGYSIVDDRDFEDAIRSVRMAAISNAGPYTTEMARTLHAACEDYLAGLMYGGGINEKAH